MKKSVLTILTILILTTSSMALEYKPDVICLTGMTPFYNIAVECAALLKTNNESN